jgi:Protein of unknown function (DUF1579)
MAIAPNLLAWAGAWRGNSRLQDPHAGIAEESASELTILGGGFVRIDYIWAYKATPQSGMMLVGQEKKSTNANAVWIDSWHMSDKMMVCQGEVERDSVLNVRGSYAAPPGPDWGWRITAELVGDELRLTMYNIWPDGKEELAVEASYRRA